MSMKATSCRENNAHVASIRRHLHVSVASLLMLLWLASCGQQQHEAPSGIPGLDPLLAQLDGMLQQSVADSTARRAEIETAKDNLATCHTAADRYEVLRNLYSCYRGYRIDSAVIVADMRLDAARQIGDPSKVISATINLAESYANAGELHKAADLLEALDTRQLAPHHVKYYYNVLGEVYTRLKNSAITPSDRAYYKDLEYATLDTLLLKTSPESTGKRLLNVRKLSSSGQRDEALRYLRQTDTTNIGAPQLYNMGQLYLELGDTANACPMLAKAAILDIRAGVKEYAALIDLAAILHSMGQTSRAYRYINVALDDAQFSGAHFRTREIMKILPVIDTEFYRMENEAMERTGRQRTIAVIFGILMLAAALLVMFQTRKLRRLSRRLNDANLALERSNDALRQADSIKLGYVTALLQTYAASDTTLRDYRRSIYRLLKAGQTDKAIDMVRNDKIDSDAFYGIFDSAVISMFPQLIETVNSMMKRPYTPKTSGSLIPELRVIAMIKLGINSIDDIARMLHYSNQTVYNHRSAIRANLAVTEEEFKLTLNRI